MPDSWLPIDPDSGYGLDNLPYGVDADGVLVAVGDAVLDVTSCARAQGSPYADLVATPSLDPLLAAGDGAWAGLRAEIVGWLTESARSGAVERHLRGRDDSTMRLPFTVGDYVDFYASEHHAANLGRILRPGTAPLLANWRHLPVAYHGRSGTIVVSGTAVQRPAGQLPPVPGENAPRFGPTERLDVEVEVGFVVGGPATVGAPVPTSAAGRRLFGVCLLNDWSARDIQAWEYQPLGPFLGKSFATSISPWIVPLSALAPARVATPSSQSPVLPYLRESGDGGYDLRLSLTVNGEVISRPTYRDVFWSPAQMLAHMTVNGASARPGDLFASGTVSGPDRSTWGSLIELSDNSRFVADGDEVVIGGHAPTAAGRIELGEVRGRVTPAATAPQG